MECNDKIRKSSKYIYKHRPKQRPRVKIHKLIYIGCIILLMNILLHAILKYMDLYKISRKFLNFKL